MDLLAAWLLFPVAVGLVALGCGLLAERLAGVKLPRTLLVPLGMATVFVAVRLLTSMPETARTALPVVLILAVAGAVLGWRRLATPPDPWVVAGALGVFAVYGAPVFLSGDPTFAGYALLPDTSHQLSLADLFATHGPDWRAVPEGSNSVSLTGYVATAYPVGAQATLGVLGPLGLLDIAWLYQPFLTVLATMMFLALHAIVAPWVEGRMLPAVVAFTGATAALTVSYALQGSIKEIAAASMLALVAAAGASVIDRPRGRSLVAPMLPGVAAYGSLGPAILPYLGLMVAALMLPWAVGTLRARQWGEVPRAAAVAALALLLALPLLVQLPTAFVASSGTLSNEELGNLAGPLNVGQATGIWLNGDYRYPPAAARTGINIALIAIAAAAAAIGFAWAAHRRATGPLLLAIPMVLATLVLLPRGNAYADGKVLALLAPTVLLMAMLGAVALLKLGRRVPGIVLMGLLTVSVLASDALAYRHVQLAPYDRYAELLRLDKRLAGRGPTIFTEYDEFGKYFLRRAGGRNQPEYPHLYQPGFTFEDKNRRPSMKTPLDLDELQLAYIQSIPNIVMRRSPTVTRPPANYRRTFLGAHYELWQRAPRTAGTVKEHIPLGPNVFEPGAKPSCKDVVRLARRAHHEGGRLAYVRRPQLPIARWPRDAHPAAWWEYGAYPGAVITAGAGVVRSVVDPTAAGRYRVWVEGSFGRALTLEVGGRIVGSVRNQTGNPGQYVALGHVDLNDGPVPVSVTQKRGGVRPGDGGWQSGLRHVGPVVFSSSENEGSTVRTISPARAMRLCGQRLDWIERLA